MEVIDQVRQAANIIEIASQYTSLTRRGNRYLGLCPFHSEKTPSFTLDDEKQLFHCFGCGAGGDVFTLVMEKEHLSFPEALRYLAQKYNISLPEKKKFSPQVKKLKEKINTITDEALAFFKKNLFNTSEGKKALTYIHKRQISDETIQRLKLGYAMNSWDALMTFFKRKNISPDLLQKSGLAIYNQKKDSYYDRFRGRVIFPIFNESGKAVAFGGRSLYDAEPKYLNSPDTPIYIKGKILYGLNFCLDAIKEKKEVILVEGYTDFVALFQAGIKNLAASLGTSLTADQVSYVKRFADKMVLCFDGDTAGTKAASRAVSLGFEKGMQTTVTLLPHGMDPDSYLKKYGSDSFKNTIEASTPGLKFLIEKQLKELKSEVPEEKTKIAKNLTNEIAKISDPVIFNEYLKQTSEYLNVEEDVLRSLIKQKTAPSMERESVVFLPAEKILLQIVFANKEMARDLLKELKEQDLKGLNSEPIFKLIMERYHKRKKLPEIHDMKDKINSSLLSSLMKLRLEKGALPTREEAQDCVESLKRRALERKCKELNAQIAQFQRNGENEKIPDLLNQISEITSRLSTLSQRNI